ncbi:hypothetical protein PLUTE_a1589 [Pseudoalteromonas luteoviolacea DSM 6061]|nr:hypothetical protein [Pseudoalteromonas luteoviolacea DSM 6061]
MGDFLSFRRIIIQSSSLVVLPQSKEIWKLVKQSQVST